MAKYIIKRILYMIPTLFVISLISFTIIQLPPGDFVDAYIAKLSSSGSVVSAEEAQNMRRLYGLDRPIYVQYGKWLDRVVSGDFGESMEWMRPVTEVIGDRLWMTTVVSLAAILLTGASPCRSGSIRRCGSTPGSTMRPRPSAFSASRCRCSGSA